MSGELNRQNPAAPAYRQPGVGHHSSFLCALCRQTRDTLGRRLLPVRGVKQWVCPTCNAARAAKARAVAP